MVDGARRAASDASGASIANLLEVRAMAGAAYDSYLAGPTAVRDVDQSLERICAGLRAFYEDRELWDAAYALVVDLDERDSFTDVVRHMASEAFATEELRLLADVTGDTRIAAECMATLESPQIAGRARSVVEQARAAVGSLVDGTDEVASFDGALSRRWRAARFLRTTIAVVGGALTIAADVVSPDPTALTRAASILGGSSAIMSQLDLPGD